MPPNTPLGAVWDIRALNFGFVSDCVLRISNLETQGSLCRPCSKLQQTTQSETADQAGEKEGPGLAPSARKKVTRHGNRGGSGFAGIRFVCDAERAVIPTEKV